MFYIFLSLQIRYQNDAYSVYGREAVYSKVFYSNLKSSFKIVFPILAFH